MGRRGPAPKPSKKKKLEGNRGRRPLNTREPEPEQGAPNCPDFLVGAAREEWERVVPQLDAMHLLTKVDLGALVCYCQAYADVSWAAAQIEENGRTYCGTNGNWCAHPAVRIMAESSKRLRLFAAEFGLTPAARTRVQTPEAAKPDDPLDTFLAHGKAIANKKS
jgi:P27 family predicted phage terminase small subunit